MTKQVCQRCDQMTLGMYDYRELSLSLSSSVWRTRVTLCPECLLEVADDLGVELPSAVVEP